MSSAGQLTGIRGFLIDAPQYDRLRSWSDGAVIIEDGLISEVGDYQTMAREPRAKPVRWLRAERSAHAAVFPGLIDIHAHLPQYPAVARGQSDLLPWLRESIFPLERQFSGTKVLRESVAFFLVHALTVTDHAAGS